MTIGAAVDDDGAEAPASHDIGRSSYGIILFG